MATLLTPPCSMPVCLAAVKMKRVKHEVEVVSLGCGCAQENSHGYYWRVSGAKD
jgi:hypothetical protein